MFHVKQRVRMCARAHRRVVTHVRHSRRECDLDDYRPRYLRATHPGRSCMPSASPIHRAADGMGAQSASSSHIEAPALAGITSLKRSRPARRRGPSSISKRPVSRSAGYRTLTLWSFWQLESHRTGECSRRPRGDVSRETPKGLVRRWRATGGMNPSLGSSACGPFDTLRDLPRGRSLDPRTWALRRAQGPSS